MDNSVGQVSSSTSDTTSNADTNGSGSEQTQTNSSQQDLDEFHEETESNIDKSDNHVLSDGRTDIGSSFTEDRSSQEYVFISKEWSIQVSKNGIRGGQQSMNSESFVRENYIRGEVNENRVEDTNEIEEKEEDLSSMEYNLDINLSH